MVMDTARYNSGDAQDTMKRKLRSSSNRPPVTPSPRFSNLKFKEEKSDETKMETAADILWGPNMAFGGNTHAKNTGYSDAEFAALLQADISGGASASATSGTGFIDPTILGAVDPLLLDCSFLNFPYTLGGSILPVDPQIGGLGIPPAPMGVISEPQTPTLGEIQTPSLPTMSALPSLMASAVTSAAPSPAPIYDDTFEDLDEADEQDEDCEGIADVQPEGPLTITFEHESAIEVPDTRGPELYQSLSVKTLDPTEDQQDNIRVFSSCPPPPPQCPQDTPEISEAQDEKQGEFNRSMKTHLWKAYPHDHHVVFTACGHEDRFFAFVESHLKMCVCDRLSRVFTDIEVVDRERANMDGEIGSWRVFNAGLEKETIEGLCPTCEKKIRKNAKRAAAAAGKRKAGGDVAGQKRDASAMTPTPVGGLLKNKRPYKRRKQEGPVIEDTITVKQYTRAKRSRMS